MRFWTSDLHFGHENIIAYANRPFGDVVDMEEKLIENWNCMVSSSDEVWIVGDFAMGQLSETLPVVKRLNGRKVLIPGNHDRCWVGAGASNHKKWGAMYDALFDIIDDFPKVTTTQLGPYTVQVCHFPRVELGSSLERHGDIYSAYRPDPVTDRNAKMINRLKRPWLIHGHTHQKVRIQPEYRQIHVGTDAWNYTPISEDTLIHLIEGAERGAIDSSWGTS